LSTFIEIASRAGALVGAEVEGLVVSVRIVGATVEAALVSDAAVRPGVGASVGNEPKTGVPARARGSRCAGGRVADRGAMTPTTT
jgi:hypothetical protein